MFSGFPVTCAAGGPSERSCGGRLWGCCCLTDRRRCASAVGPPLGFVSQKRVAAAYTLHVDFLKVFFPALWGEVENMCFSSVSRQHRGKSKVLWNVVFFKIKTTKENGINAYKKYYLIFFLKKNGKQMSLQWIRCNWCSINPSWFSKVTITYSHLDQT